MFCFGNFMFNLTYFMSIGLSYSMEATDEDERYASLRTAQDAARSRIVHDMQVERSLAKLGHSSTTRKKNEFRRALLTSIFECIVPQATSFLITTRPTRIQIIKHVGNLIARDKRLEEAFLNDFQECLPEEAPVKLATWFKEMVRSVDKTNVLFAWVSY